jgi:hypothetical protein
VQYQTATHTLSLILAALGSADDNMRRYLDMKGLAGALDKLYKPGDSMDFMNLQSQPVAWAADGSPVTLRKAGASLLFEADCKGVGGIAFPAPQERGISLSGGLLRLRYRSAKDVKKARITFKRTHQKTKALETIPVEISLAMQKTSGKEESIEICLPATPALQGIQETALGFGEQGQRTQEAITLTAFEFKPL